MCPQSKDLGKSVSVRTAVLVTMLCALKSSASTAPRPVPWGHACFCALQAGRQALLGRLLPVLPLARCFPSTDGHQGCGHGSPARSTRTGPLGGVPGSGGRCLCAPMLPGEGVWFLHLSGAEVLAGHWSLTRAPRRCPATEWGRGPSSPCDGPGALRSLQLGWASFGCEDLSGFWTLVTYPSARTLLSVPGQGPHAGHTHPHSRSTGPARAGTHCNISY